MEQCDNNKQKILQQIQKFIVNWKDLLPKDIEVTKLTGCSNITSKIQIINPKLIHINPNKVIHRKFGGGAGGLIQKDVENYIFNILSQNNFGPNCLGLSDDYRLEEFIEMEHPTRQIVESNQFQRKLMQLLNDLHQFQIDTEVIGKIPLCQKVLKDESVLVTKFTSCYNQFITQNKHGENNIYVKHINIMKNIYSLIQTDERKFLMEEFNKVCNENDIGFTHNDIIAYNMFIKMDQDSIQQIKLIDFEYASLNLIGYDIANFLSELAINYQISIPPYFEIDFTKYPTQSRIKELCMYYLFFKALKEKKNKEIDKKQIDALIFNFNNFQEIFPKVMEIDDSEKLCLKVDGLVRQVNFCLLMAQYYWGVWSILQATPEIRFDYFQHAQSRYEAYQFLRTQYLQLYNINYI